MVVKLLRVTLASLRLFESRVILDGSQTTRRLNKTVDGFESRVILDGSQTSIFW